MIRVGDKVVFRDDPGLVLVVYRVELGWIWARGPHGGSIAAPSDRFVLCQLRFFG